MHEKSVTLFVERNCLQFLKVFHVFAIFILADFEPAISYHDMNFLAALHLADHCSY